MPLYAYKCPACGTDTEDFNRVDDRHTNAPVCQCGTRMAMQICPVRGNVQQDAHYVCPATGEKVTSWRQRRNIMAKHDLVDARDINTPEARRKRREAKRAKLERAKAACPQIADAVAVYNQG